MIENGSTIKADTWLQNSHFSPVKHSFSTFLQSLRTGMWNNIVKAIFILSTCIIFTENSFVDDSSSEGDYMFMEEYELRSGRVTEQQVDILKIRCIHLYFLIIIFETYKIETILIFNL